MASKDHDLVDTGITFASGAAYGMTTVAVGQPFDTIKTVVQSSGESTVAATRKVIAESGVIKGLWRGSLPLVLGGTCAGRVLFLLPRQHGRRDAPFVSTSHAGAGSCGARSSAATTSRAML